MTASSNNKKKKRKKEKDTNFCQQQSSDTKCAVPSLLLKVTKKPWRNQRAETVVVIIQTDCYILLMGPPPRSLKGKRRRRKRKKNELSIYNSLQVKSKASIVTGRERERERKKGIDWATPEENFATVSHSVRRIFLSFFCWEKRNRKKYLGGIYFEAICIVTGSSLWKKKKKRDREILFPPDFFSFVLFVSFNSTVLKDCAKKKKIKRDIQCLNPHALPSFDYSSSSPVGLGKSWLNLSAAIGKEASKPSLRQEERQVANVNADLAL